jgi:hypothetical protein
LKLSSDGGDCGSRECKRGCGGVLWSLESRGRFRVGAFGVFSLLEDVFTFDLLFKEIFTNFVLSMQFTKAMLQ